MPIAIDCFGLTDKGKVREVNEDQFLVADLDKTMRVAQTSLPDGDHARRFGVHHGKLLLVADGMGGHAGGKQASGVAVQTVVRYILNTMPWFFRLEEGREEDLEDELKAVLEECQRTVKAAGDAPSGHKTMGTTLTLAYLIWPRLYVVHAGDSRCYVRRDGKLHPITRDHTVAQRMVDKGVMSAERAENSRWGHVLWNCVGGGTDDVRADVYKATCKPGDVILLCSDGLSKYVADDEIGKALDAADSAEAAAHTLVDAANAAGGSDNITVVVARTQEGVTA